MKKIFAALFAFLFLCAPFSGTAELEVHFLNVGQGDCTIVLCDGEAMVIDGGPPGTSDYVYSYIRNTLELAEVQTVVSTHPHLDHVGGLPAVLNAAPAETILTPVLDWDSKAFRRMMEYADLSGAQVEVPSEGEYFPLGGATVTVLHCWPEAMSLTEPDGKRYSRTNDTSIVVRIDYGDTSFIVTGDAEDYSEYMMIDSGMDLKADVLRVGHHGSRYSTTGEFLRAVQPAYAVISVARDNSYGHPHPETLERLEKAGARVLRTDELGTVVMASDGKKVWAE